MRQFGIGAFHELPLGACASEVKVWQGRALPLTAKPQPTKVRVLLLRARTHRAPWHGIAVLLAMAALPARLLRSRCTVAAARQRNAPAWPRRPRRLARSPMYRPTRQPARKAPPAPLKRLICSTFRTQPRFVFVHQREPREVIRYSGQPVVALRYDLSISTVSTAPGLAGRARLLVFPSARINSASSGSRSAADEAGAAPAYRSSHQPECERRCPRLSSNVGLQKCPHPAIRVARRCGACSALRHRLRRRRTCLRVAGNLRGWQWVMDGGPNRAPGGHRLCACVRVLVHAPVP